MRKPLAIFFAIALGTLTAGAEKPFPRGTMVVLPVGDPDLSDEACWSDPNILGVVLRTTWNDTEKTQGTFNWDFLDLGVLLAQNNKKFVVLSITAVRPPSWVTNVVKTWMNSLHKTCPYPWDPNLQSFWGTLIKNLGQRYDGVSCVHGVDMWVGGTGGAVGTGSGIDCIFAPAAADCTALDAIAGGGTNSGKTLWSNACEALCTIYTNAFPNTPCFLQPGTNYVNLDPQSMDTVSTWWLNQRSSGNSLFNNGFSTRSPHYIKSLGYIPWPYTSLNITTIHNGMFQTLAPIGNPQMNGATLAEVFQNVQNIIAVQIYPTDPATDPGEQTIITFNKSVGQ
jgi:hypothetical protein